MITDGDKYHGLLETYGRRVNSVREQDLQKSDGILV